MARTRAFALLVAAAATLLGLALFVPHTSAREVEGFTLDHNNNRVSQDFDPITQSEPTWPYIEEQARTLGACRSNAFNYVHGVRLRMNQQRENGHETTILLTWPETVDDNNLHMSVFDNNGDRLVHDFSGDPDQPRALRDAVDLPNGDIWVCVWNYWGQNEGYTISAEVKMLPFFERQPIEATPRPTQTTSAPSRPTSAPTEAPTPAAAPTTPDEPGIDPERIATPGPDGDLTQRNLLGVASGRQAAALEDTGRGIRILFTLLTLLIAAAGGTFVALRIRRDRA